MQTGGRRTDNMQKHKRDWWREGGWNQEETERQATKNKECEDETEMWEKNKIQTEILPYEEWR